MTSELAASYDPLGAHVEDPYPFYEQARRREPVFFSPRLDAWVVNRFADVDAILKDPAGFSSVNTLRPFRELYPATRRAGRWVSADHVTSDAAVHRRLREPYARHLTAAGRIKGLEPGIRARAAALAGTFADDGRADLVARFSGPLPAETAAGVFGFAAEDVATAREGSECLFALGGSDCIEAEEAAAARTVVAFQLMLIAYARRRRATPTGDLISDVVAALAWWGGCPGRPPTPGAASRSGGRSTSGGRSPSPCAGEGPVKRPERCAGPRAPWRPAPGRRPAACGSRGRRAARAAGPGGRSAPPARRRCRPAGPRPARRGRRW